MRYIIVLACLVLSQMGWSNEIREAESYQGYWRFVKEDFSKRHPLWLSFMINKALNTRLYLNDKYFMQYVKPNKLDKPAENIVEVKKVNEGGWRFVRKKQNDLIKFEIVRENDKWIYREGKMEYELIKTTEEDVKKWESNQ